LVAGDINTVSTIRIKALNGFIQHQFLIEMPSTVTYTGLVNYSVAGTGYRYVIKQVLFYLI
jgi:hypothetical protein